MGVRILLFKEGMSTKTLDTPNFGDGRGICDREGDRRGDLFLTTLLSIVFNYMRF